jgi:hypothetical protein
MKRAKAHDHAYLDGKCIDCGLKYVDKSHTCEGCGRRLPEWQHCECVAGRMLKHIAELSKRVEKLEKSSKKRPK